MDTISWYGRLNTARRRGALRFKKCVFIRPRATRPSDDPSSTRFPDVPPSTHLSVSRHPQGPRATQPSDDSPSTRFSDVLPSTQRSGVFTMRTGQGPHSSGPATQCFASHSQFLLRVSVPAWVDVRQFFSILSYRLHADWHSMCLLFPRRIRRCFFFVCDQCLHFSISFRSCLFDVNP